jgi:sigma-E factor negative regulatory protein RseB
MSMRLSLARFPVILVGLWCATALHPAGAETDVDVGAWLQRMSEAVRTLNYRGSFVYLHGGRMEAMRIVHGYRNGQERERLVHLNGSPREVVRDNHSVTCILPDDAAVVVEKSQPQRLFPAPFSADLKLLRPYYRFALSSGGRMTGRNAHKITIAPRDSFRYGYQLWVDAETGLLLKSDVVDASGHALEQIMFVSLDILDAVPEAELRPADAQQDWERHEEPLEQEETAASGDPGWAVAWMPEGFRNSARQQRHLPAAAAPVHFLNYSDGLASLSIFIEKLDTASVAVSQGALSVGAVNAYGVVVDHHYATVVGEVPLDTARRVAESIRYRLAGFGSD